MARIPTLPLDTYEELFPFCGNEEGLDEKLRKMSLNPFVREALTIASPSLLNSLQALNNTKDEKRYAQVKKSLIRYLSRMSTRPTPFGFFSAIFMGNFQDIIDDNKKEVNFNKRARPDMRWLLKIVKQLEKKTEVLVDLDVYVNPLNYKVGSRILLPYITLYGQNEYGQENINDISFKVNDLLTYIMKVSKKPIKYNLLLKKISEEFSIKEYERINNYLMTLVNKEFLLSELRPSLMDIDPFKYIIDVLERKSQRSLELLNDLNGIYNKLKKYNQIDIGKGNVELSEILDKMNKVCNSNHLLSIDTSFYTQDLKLPNKIKRDAEEIANILYKISPADNNLVSLENYKHTFLEEYGSHRLVPILELLDENLGLGYPESYKEIPKYNKTVSRDNILKALLTESLINNSHEIELTDKVIEKMSLTTVKRDKSQIPSLELYFTILSPSISHLNNGDYSLVLGSFTGTDKAGKTFGRFIDLFNQEGKENLAQLNEVVNKFDSEACIAELTYLPRDGKQANISITNNFNDYEIVIGTKSSKDEAHTIPINDLYVGYSSGRLYLKSHSLNKEVVPTISHNLNFLYGTPPIYRFICELGLDRYSRWQPFNWGELDNFPVLPRIRYKKVIISPATWRINRRTLKVDSDDWYLEIKLWRENYNVPRYIYLTEGDNKLLLDLENEYHQNSLKRNLSKLEADENIKLVEVGKDFDINNSWFKSMTGSHLVECVIPLVRDNKANVLNKINSSVNINKRVNSLKPSLKKCDKLHLPGSKWFFIKLYHYPSSENELIGFHIKEICNKLIGEEISDCSFFMRYRDPKPHIRLRFHGEFTEISARLIPWAKLLKSEELIFKFVIDSYEQETERYGGPEAIQLAEQFFSVDSKVTSEWISNELKGLTELEKEVIGVLSCIDILDKFNIDLDELISWLDNSVSKKLYRKEYQQMRKVLRTICSSEQPWVELNNFRGGQIIYKGFKERHKILQRYVNKIYELNNVHLLHNTLFGIIDSIIHLHLNRLFGINRDKEIKIMTLLRHILNDIKHTQINNINQE